MILSAGLTPAWQHIVVFDHFSYGEVNRAADAHWCASGKVINAGIAVHRLGGKSLMLAPAGGLPFAAMEAEMAELGVPRRWIETRAATRVCTTILDRATGSMTELVEEARPLGDDELDAFLVAYREAAARAEVAIVIGSLPTGCRRSMYREMVAATRCPMVLDFRGAGLVECLEFRPRVVKPNREELGQTVGRELTTDAELHAAMRSLNDRGAQWVLVTQGGGPVWLSSTTELYRFEPLPPERVVNPIGCGDAIAAGVAWGLRAGQSMPEAVALGMAAAADNLGQLLAGRLDAPRVFARAAEVVCSRCG